jgi:UDP-3-O-[3-hydroxymyristoyl] glucosamine N-acyltransferase
MTLAEIVAALGGELIGEGGIRVGQVAPLESAGPADISFISQEKYGKQLAKTRAGAVILPGSLRDATGLARIVCANPYAYYARVTALLNPEAGYEAGVHASAVVEAGVSLGAGASVGAHAYVARGVSIGAGSVVGAGCVIGEDARIGSDCRLYPNVTVYHRCSLGDRVIIHSGAVIGADGFGMASENGRWIKIPQIGRVLIGNDVEIGANTTIDRGALNDTVIGDGVKLDNQIQVAHNVVIGAHSAMAGCVGIAGSARIGARCTVGGGAVVLGHLELVDDVHVSAATLITKSVAKPGVYTSAMPFESHERWRRNAAQLRHLDELAERVKSLEQKLKELEEK